MKITVFKGENDMPPLIDLTGEKFNKLLVLKRGPNKGRYTAWECQCDCGNIILVRGADLKNGHTKSWML